jgi:hypothetical protein
VKPPGSHWSCALLVATGLAATPAAVHAAGPWFSLGVLAGTTRPDGDLADYQLNTTPHGAWGAQALAGAGRCAGGVRVWTTRTTQEIGIPGAPAGPAVGLTSWEVVGQGRVASVWGNHVALAASVGLLHMAYDPDQLAFDPGTGTPIVVNFAPVNEWIVGGGLALERSFTPSWGLGLQIDHRVFGLDTAHRNGSEIEYSRETFGDWSARLQLARHWGRR